MKRSKTYTAKYNYIQEFIHIGTYVHNYICNLGMIFTRYVEIEWTERKVNVFDISFLENDPLETLLLPIVKCASSVKLWFEKSSCNELVGRTRTIHFVSNT